MPLTVQQMLQGCSTGVRLVVRLNVGFSKYGLDTPAEQAMFLANAQEESAGFQKLAESLTYTDAQHLADTFPSHFHHDASQAAPYVRNPVALANLAYANEGGNGDPASGDGWNYRGGGLFGLTFKDNYAEASQEIYGDDRLVQHPELTHTDDVAVETALWYWKKHCQAAAQRGDFKAATKAINPALAGWSTRQANLVKFNKALGVTA